MHFISWNYVIIHMIELSSINCVISKIINNNKLTLYATFD